MLLTIDRLPLPRSATCAAALLVVLGACSAADPRVYGQARHHVPPPAAAGSVEVTFLGGGGFVLRRAGQGVMTPPLYSTAPLKDVLARGKRIASEPARIDPYLPDGSLADVAAILVGHSHYDHLLDVPYIAQRKAPRAVVYGSRTMTHLLAGSLSEARRKAFTRLGDPARDVVDYRMCRNTPDRKRQRCTNPMPDSPGDWVPVAGDQRNGPGIRVRALCSLHSPQFAGLLLWKGCLEEDVEPVSAADWLLGDTYAYLIDFLEDGRPVFRVYYQDSPVERPIGFPSDALLRDKAIDLAVLCAGAFDEVAGENPRPILEHLRPRYVLLGHWEDFFSAADRPLRAIPSLDVPKLLARVAAGTGGAKPWQGRYWLPTPGAHFVFPPSP